MIAGGVTQRSTPFAVAMLAWLLSGCAGASSVWRGVTSFSPGSSTSAPAGSGLIGADGRCAEAADEAALTGAGIGLGMSECEVARRAGVAERVDITANERGERVAVLAYPSGSSPGVYRFVSGRLVSIERAPDMPVAEPRSATKGRKPARR